MSDSNFRYLFLCRQRFSEAPEIDSFYEIRSPINMTSDELTTMRGLKNGWMEEELSQDSETLRALELRLRFNADMFQKVVLVKTEVEITAEDLEMVIQDKHKEGVLMDFLNSAAI